MEEVLALEHPLLKVPTPSLSVSISFAHIILLSQVPYEQLCKTFQASQKLVESEMKNIVSKLTQIKDPNSPGGLQTLNTLAERLASFKKMVGKVWGARYRNSIRSCFERDSEEYEKGEGEQRGEKYGREKKKILRLSTHEL